MREDRTKEQLMEELVRLRQRVAELEAAKAEHKRAEERVQAYSLYLETLLRINATLGSTAPLKEVLKTIAQGAGELFNYVGALIVVPDATGKRLILGAVWGKRFVNLAVRLTGFDIASFSLPLTARENPIAWAYLSGELQAWSRAPERIVIGVEPAISPKLAPLIERAMGARLAACVPLPAGERVVGVLVVLSPREQLSDQERAILLGLADQAGLAIKNARLYEAAQQEIAARKRVEEELRHERDRIQKYLDVARVMMVALNARGEITLINQKGCEVLGYEESELVGKNWFDTCLPVQIREEVKPVFRRLMAGEIEPVEYYENPIVTRFGEERIIAWHNTVLTDDAGNVIGILSSGEDITERVRAEEELQHTLAKLREALGGIIQTVASIVEVKDPYTAGHQRRVADLAQAIATEMGLPQEQIEGIRMTGLIHDLGKIAIPAEILSTPSRLNDIQWDMIKTHPQVGYDILKRIDFPWPVAKIVLQHHERMDGSGYPQGLSGEEIMLEARILAVADVVEAMVSHRPYRPAHSIDEALEEISRNRGILYDPEVVDACVRLFTEKGFKLK